jgi:hypothetical protein
MSTDTDDGSAADDDSCPKGHADLKELAKKLRRPLRTLYALDTRTDPWMSDQDWRSEIAHWFADLRDQLNVGVSHIRAIWYRLISQRDPVLRVNGSPIENTDDCYRELNEAIRDARHLDLIPGDAIIDRRNPPPVINRYSYSDTSAESEVANGGIYPHEYGVDYQAPTLSLPETLLISEPRIGQRYHLETWIEKSTANDVLLPLGRQYGMNIATFVGQVSVTACKKLVDRAIASGRPVRIFYISDFDPAGRSMPVAAAGKIAFEVMKSGRTGLDIRLELVALTEEQCTKYRLPRTPIRETAAGGKGFQERFGDGMTELDALEALHPGELERLLVEHIERYYDHDLDTEVSDAVDRFNEEIDDAESRMRELYSDELAELDGKREAITQAFEQVRSSAQATYDAAVEPTRRAYLAAEAQATLVFNETLEQARDEIEEMEQDFIAEAKPLLEVMTETLAELAPDPDQFDWPEPADADEWGDPLYDSSRSYVEQVDRFRAYQGLDSDVRYMRDRVMTKTCQNPECGNTFETKTQSPSREKYCKRKCSNRHQYLLSVERVRHDAQGKADTNSDPLVKLGAFFTHDREGNGQRARRRHQLDDAPVCAIHPLDARGRAAEARHREISSVGAFHPPRHRSTGQSCGRCGPIFDWSVPYGDLSISPTIYLSYRGEKCFAQLPKVANGSIQWNEHCPYRTLSWRNLHRAAFHCLRDVRQTDYHRQR